VIYWYHRQLRELVLHLLRIICDILMSWFLAQRNLHMKVFFFNNVEMIIQNYDFLLIIML
jgi:hypothetical protein